MSHALQYVSKRNFMLGGVAGSVVHQVEHARRRPEGSLCRDYLGTMPVNDHHHILNE